MNSRTIFKCLEIVECDVDNEHENELPSLYDHEDASVEHTTNDDVPMPKNRVKSWSLIFQYS